ncbi:CvpA family protein [Campylobacter sp. FMV-PI01]|uniref:CvpA family protein n=1 Tax=Campylobacter portucalensis TaxID=2608384 RepID=A0A6L5WHF3_9BACT|nr:CvpA family protein [Campylobacter portucalensis]MSN95627.1 CvpA family protein [Campylobacter portucalensis]
MSAGNWFDAIILFLVLVFALKGLKSGVIREIFGIIGMIGGFLIALKFKNEVGAWINLNIYDIKKLGILEGNGTEILIGFIATMFGIWIIALIMGEILSKLLGLSGLGFLDKIGGFAFGGAKVFLIFSILATFIHSSTRLNMQAQKFFSTSLIYEYLINTGAYLMGIKTANIQQQIKNLENNKTDTEETIRNLNTEDRNISIMQGEINETTIN